MPSGAAVVVDNNSSGYSGQANVTIEGGDFDTASDPVVSLKTNGNDITIEKGNFNKPVKTNYLNSNKWYVDFVIDGENIIVGVEKNGKLADADIPKPTKSGYTFVGWYTEQNYQNVFDTTAEIKNDTTVYAKFIKNATSSTTPSNQEENPSDTTPVVPEAQAPDTTDAKNPNTADNFYSLISMLIASAAGLFIVFKKNILN